MRKNLFILLATIFLAGPHILNAQNTFPSTGAAGIGTASPDASSLLEIKSTTKGFLTPRMTLVQRNAIATPGKGLLIFQTNATPGFYYYTGSAWAPVSPKGVNKTLSNLTSPTAINVDLLPDSANLRSIGSSDFPWKHINGMNINNLGASTAIGTGALDSNQNIFNTAVGGFALSYNTAGAFNTACGAFTLEYNKTGTDNTACGAYTLRELISGTGNTAYGAGAMESSTTSNENTAIGDAALQILVEGDYNVAIGSVAGQNTIGTQNTFVGTSAGRDNTNGGYNTAVGINAAYNGNAKVGSNNTYIGGYTDGPTNSNNSTVLGYGALITTSNQIRLGNGSVTSIGGYAGWSNVSDGRVKKNIKQNVPGLSFINKLQPVTYNLDLEAVDKITQRPAMKDKDGKTIQPSQNDMDARNAKEQIIYTGFIAQDVEKAAKSLNYDFSGVDAAKNDKDLYGLRYSEFVVPLVKAVQELNDSLEKTNASLQAQIDDLKKMVQALANNKQAAASSNTILLSSASLQQNIPNPYSSKTTISYTLPDKFSSAQIIINDNSGKTLQQINVSGKGKGTLTLDAAALSSGYYNYSLLVDGKLAGTKKMLLIK